MSDETDEKQPPQGPPAPPAGGAGAGELMPISIEEEMRTSYLAYSMSVIVGRALPDVRDGLKPVHRRALYAMHELGNHWNRAYKKSARVVGDVIGKYHPHGDSAVYDAVVRLAQPWAMRYPLVDGQGNFGSVDGDSAAAMRYTEVRMARLAEELLSDIDEDTVDFGPNYDDNETEPLVLPSRFPNLLVNGSAGIAVGMATNVPPHNLGEIISATIHLADNPHATIADLMEHVQGPDFPTAGFIMGKEGILRAYTTGRGHITLRARAEIETSKKDRETIAVTEIPYQVNKARLIERIAELVKDKKIEGISDIRDESDRHGMRIAIDLKRDAMASVVLNNLYMQTPMQTTFGALLLSIDGGRPRTMNLKEILERFIAHRREVVTRRTRFRLKKARARLHVVEGLLVAQDLIDQVITIIRKSRDVEEARWGLMHILSPSLHEHERFVDLERIDLDKARAQMDALVARVKGDFDPYQGFSHTYEGGGFSEEQAKSILEMRLQRLTGLQREELFKELIELLKNIAYLEDILAHEASLLRVIKEELEDVRSRYADARRTEIVGSLQDITSEDLIAEEDMVVTLSHSGYVKRNPLTEYRAQKRGGRGRTGASTREDDFISNLYVASTHAYMMPITTRGRLHWLKVHAIPQGSRAARGKAIVNLVQLQPEEKLASVVVARELSDDCFLFFVTRKGIVKRTDLSAFSNVRSTGIIALGIEDGDALVSVHVTDGKQDMLLATAKGMCIRFAETDVRSMGRTAYGVKGITLDKDDEVVGAAVLEPEGALLTVTANGYGKRTMSSEYRLQGRGGKGIIDIKTTDRNGPVVGVLPVHDDDQVMIVTDGGILIRMRVNEVSLIGRNTQGVRLIAVGKNEEKVTALSKLPEASGEDADEDEAGELATPVEKADVDPAKVVGEAAAKESGSGDDAGTSEGEGSESEGEEPTE